MRRSKPCWMPQFFYRYSCSNAMIPTRKTWQAPIVSQAVLCALKGRVWILRFIYIEKWLFLILCKDNYFFDCTFINSQFSISFAIKLRKMAGKVLFIAFYSDF